MLLLQLLLRLPEALLCTRSGSKSRFTLNIQKSMKGGVSMNTAVVVVVVVAVVVVAVIAAIVKKRKK
ncbi:hypothetical protein GPK94_06395 [Pseudoflavonifractor sp. MCC625]|nr:hypothetical protein [Pseudoflavonifractor sp. MCC625]